MAPPPEPPEPPEPAAAPEPTAAAPADPAAQAELLRRTADGWHPAPLRDGDPLPAAPAAALSAVLDLPESVAPEGAALPPLWHWLHFLAWPRERELGEDGHPGGGHFLPPLPDRRRMFAGGRLEVRAPLIVGTPAERVSTLAKTEAKTGRTGPMLFVTVRSEISQRGSLRLVEEQDIVYRIGDGRPPLAGPDLDLDGEARSDAPWQLGLRPDSRLLFRYSALTANAHRIHYDQPYVTGTEGYPGLVVHGPLLAMLMLELARRNAPGRTVRSLSYRLKKPVFAGEHVLACGGPTADGGGAALRIATVRADEHATAEVVFA